MGELKLVVDGNSIELTPDPDTFSKAFAQAEDGKETYICYNGKRYPWLCGLCPRSLLQLLFPDEDPCSTKDCLKLIQRLK